jgi:hypothetical protein
MENYHRQNSIRSFLKSNKVDSEFEKKGRQSRIVGGEKKTPLNQWLKIHRRQRTPK